MSPHPDWKPGLPQPSPHGSAMVALDPTKLKSCYPLMISAYVPRPIALVSSMSKAGVVNLAPYSFSGLVCHDPPTLVVSVTASRANADKKKDTLANIDDSGEFVVNLMSEWFAEAANHTSGDFVRGVDEFHEAGLTKVDSVKVKAPRVAESAVHFECVVRHRHEIPNKTGATSATLIVAEVVMVHVAEPLLDLSAGEDKPAVKFEGLKPLSRLGGLTYGTTGGTFDLPRPNGTRR